MLSAYSEDARARQESGLQARNDQLQTALDAQREINVAVGIAMMQYRMPRAEAFEFLRTAARKQRRKLPEVAQEIIRSNESLHAD